MSRALQKVFLRAYTSFKYIILILACVRVASCIRLGLFNGNLHRVGAPVLVRRYHHHAPVYIRISPPLYVPRPPPRPYSPAPLAHPRPAALLYPRASLKPALVPTAPPPRLTYAPTWPPRYAPAKAWPVTSASPLGLKAKMALLEKLGQLQKCGSLSQQQFLRFRKMLLTLKL